MTCRLDIEIKEGDRQIEYFVGRLVFIFVTLTMCFHQFNFLTKICNYFLKDYNFVFICYFYKILENT